MRIALLCPDVSSNALVRTYPIAKVLARKHDIRLLGFRFGEEVFAPYRDEFAYDVVAVRRFPAFVGQIQKLARRIDADAIYAFKPLPSSLWVGLRARTLHRIPLFLDVEDWETGWYLDVPARDAAKHLLHVDRPNGFLWTWLTERLVRRADETFVVSRFLQRRFGGTLLVHGADTAFFDPARWDAAEARRRLGLPTGRYVVFTGSPSPRKGVDDLLDAVARLRRRDVRVLLVGSFRHDPAYQRRLLERHRERLIITAPRPHSEMPMFLAAADVVALPQRRTRASEAQVPGKVFEAMAMARPIVATAVSDLPEILADAGRIVSPGSIDELANALGELLDDPFAAAAYGRRARERCAALYSWDAMERVLEERLSRWQTRL